MQGVKIIYEEKDFAAINKPAGMLVHGTKVGKGEKTLVDAVLEQYPEIRTVGDDPETRPGIVHRLDKDTSGILIIARNQAFFDYFKALLQAHKVKKAYMAIVRGKLDREGKIEAPIALKSGTTRRTTRTKGQKMEKPAVTKYHALEYLQYEGEVFTLVKLMPETGRTHQLRVHMAHIHHPILGDTLYGGKKAMQNAKRQMLHAYALEFEMSDGGMIRLEAPIPDDFENLLKTLRGG